LQRAPDPQCQERPGTVKVFHNQDVEPVPHLAVPYIWKTEKL